jgi:hypothetical protein
MTFPGASRYRKRGTVPGACQTVCHGELLPGLSWTCAFWPRATQYSAMPIAFRVASAESAKIPTHLSKDPL